MAVSPIDTRYFTEMNSIFDEENKLQTWLDVEAALAHAHAAVGNMPKSAAREIAKKASLKFVKLKRMKQIEAEISHDLMAMVKALTEVCKKDAGRYVHMGATSYDIEDTALALQLKQAVALIEKELKLLLKILLKRAEENKNTVCIGRTHGQQGVPTTYGMKFSVWAWEIHRHLQRIQQAKERLFVGKISGAVGTMAQLGEKAFEIQRAMMKELGLAAAPVTTQVIQRDRYAEALAILSLIASTLEKITKEIRNLQRTEIGEVAESFGKKQVGSSTMPHKRNPHRSERVCSIARVVRSHLHVALENIPLEHERDLTNSANERIIIPESFILCHYMLKETSDILANLVICHENIARNLNFTRGLVMAERVMLALTKKGMGRQEAHELLREASIETWKSGKEFKDILLANEKITKLVSEDELSSLLDPRTYIGKAAELVEKTIKELG